MNKDATLGEPWAHTLVVRYNIRYDMGPHHMKYKTILEELWALVL
jgi:hypothetical protein